MASFRQRHIPDRVYHVNYAADIAGAGGASVLTPQQFFVRCEVMASGTRDIERGNGVV
jgi:hypothetical protein